MTSVSTKSEAARALLARAGHRGGRRGRSTRVLEPGHEGIGWLAQAGEVPLGYLGDADKTARTFPVIDGRALRRSPGTGPGTWPTARSSCWAATR